MKGTSVHTHKDLAVTSSMCSFADWPVDGDTVQKSQVESTLFCWSGIQWGRRRGKKELYPLSSSFFFLVMWMNKMYVCVTVTAVVLRHIIGFIYIVLSILRPAPCHPVYLGSMLLAEHLNRTELLPFKDFVTNLSLPWNYLVSHSQVFSKRLKATGCRDQHYLCLISK